MTSKFRILTKQYPAGAALALLLLLVSGLSQGQITPSADSYTNTADATTNYGSKTLLDVDGASQITYIQFNLASIPTTASISQATLKLYVNGVTTAGSFNVDYINSTWSESTIDASNAPPLGSAIASNVNVTTAEKKTVHPHQCDFGVAGMAERERGEQWPGAGGQQRIQRDV